MNLRLTVLIVLIIQLSVQGVIAQTVLMFVSHEQTYYSEYIVMKEALEAQGYAVEVRSASAMDFSIYMSPYADIPASANDGNLGSSYTQFQAQFEELFGESWDETQNTIPDFDTTAGAITDVSSIDNYVGLIVVGGTGSLEYRVDGVYTSQGVGDRLVSATDIQATAEKLNDLALEALQQGKPVMAQCHGASIPAFWRIPETSGPDEEALGFSLLKGGESTGFPEPETAPMLQSLDITHRSTDRVTITSPHSSFEDNDMGESRIITTRDWYPQSVAYAARTFLNVLESYPIAAKRTSDISVLLLHGGAVDESNMPSSCFGGNKTNDVPCNNGTEDENLPADYTHLLELLAGSGSSDDFNFTTTDLDLSGTLPFGITNETEILTELEGYDVVIFFKHWSTHISDELQNAMVEYADNGGGVISLHHGLYNDIDNGQNKDILANQLFGAHSTQNGWSATLTTYTVHSTNFGHFISSYLIDYETAQTDPAAWIGTPLPASANTGFSTTHTFDIYDELYNNMTFIDLDEIGRGVGQITPLFSNDRSTASIAHTTGFTREVDFDENGTIGKVVYFEIGERKENINSSSRFGQIVRNAVVWAAPAKQTQSISFAPTTEVTYGDESIALPETASSGLAIVYESSDNGVIAIDNGSAVIVGNGTATITASQAGNATYYAAEDVLIEFTVSKAALSATAENKSRVYAEENPTLSILYDGFVNDDDADDITEPQISTSATSESNAGTYDITLTGGSADNYTISLTSGTLTINQATQEIIPGNLSQLTFGDDPVLLTSTATSNLEVQYDVTNGPIAIQNNNQLIINGAGAASLSLTQPGDINYEAAEAASLNFEILKANQGLVIGSIGNKLSNQEPFDISISSDSDLPYTVSVDGPATNDGNTITLTGTVGTVEITVNAAANENYLVAETSTSFEVTAAEKQNQTISFGALENRTFSQNAKFSISAEASSGLDVTFSRVDGPVEVNGPEITITGAGTATIRASQSGNDSFNPAPNVDVSFTIEKATQTITITEIASVTTSSEPIAIEATVDSDLELTIEVDGPATLTDNTVTLTKELGIVTATILQAGNENYMAAEASISFEVTTTLPTSIDLSTHSVDENKPSGTVVGELTTADFDENDIHSYTLVEGEGDDDNALFTIDGIELKTATPFDFETKSTYSIRIKTDDGNDGTLEQVFSIAISDVYENSAPTAINLSLSEVDENVANGAMVGELSADDVDESDMHTFTLVSGEGDSDNASFTIEDNQLKTASSFDFETQSDYSIRIKADDGNGGTHEQVFEITINNVDETVTSVNDELFASIHIFPNPVSSIININTSATGSAPLKIQILQLNGQSVMERIVDQPAFQLDVSKLKAGKYLLQLSSEVYKEAIRFIIQP
ncbi:MAG: MBG domain-containing protein [Cyclobacteriaceae bacterium]